jgi:predicted nucleic-acid-binding Zn-ribbon protein
MEKKNRNCLRCREEMTKVSVIPGGGGGALLIETIKSGFFKGKTSSVDAFVCTKCGYVELVAENPAIFKEQ